MSEQKTKIKYLVADTTAFINAVPLNEYAENVLTVPDVIREVRNKRQIRRLCVLPFDLQVREPRLESLKHCVEYAKKTGDYASLSGIDMKVIALAYELEAEHVGTQHLRTEPIISKVIASKDKPKEFQEDTKLAGWYSPDSNESSDEGTETDEETEEDPANLNKDDQIKSDIEKRISMGAPDSTFQSSLYDEEEDITQEELNNLFEKLRCEAKLDENACDILVSTGKSGEDEANLDKSVNADDKTNSSQQNDDDSDGNEHGNDDENDNGWITPSNIKKIKKALEVKLEDEVVPTAACMSTDFAIQNVLKQMNLNICALNGKVIKHLRTYILRCYACYKTTSIMTKVFCPNCGNKTLKRVAVSLDENDKQVIHINTRRPLTSKYKNKSVPRFHGGKHSHNPILFEDQPMPRQMPSRVAKTKTNALDEDYIAGFSPFVMRDIDSKSAILRSKGHIKEWARNTTYEEERRKKDCNRLYK